MPRRPIIQSSLLSLDSRNDLSRVLACAEFKVPDTLPGTGVQTAICNGNRHRSTDEGRFDMRLK